MFLIFKKFAASRARVLTLSLILLAFFGHIDFVTGPNVALTCFYLLPVCLLSWYCGYRAGLIVAIVHALVWLAIDLETLPNHSPFIYWNAAVRFITFAVIVGLVHLCKNLRNQVEALIEIKTAALQREVDTRTHAEESLRKLSNQLSAAEDAERRRLGQELHDSLGQSLSLLKLRMQSLDASLPAADPHAADVRQSLALLDSVIQQSRTLTFELHPAMLDQLGLTATLQHYAAQLSTQASATIRVADSGLPMTLPAPLASFLFRAVKELITNALKHGPAREILVQIRRRHGHIRIVVNDDGAGFKSPPSADSRGLGLASIRQRLTSFGGTLDIDSAHAHGARVTIDLPLIPSRPLFGSIPHGQPVTG